MNDLKGLNDEPSDPSSSSSGSTSSRSRGHRRRRPASHHRRGHRNRRRHSRSSSKELIKPLKPEKYSGAEKIQDFTRFVAECKDYIETAHVKPHRHVLVISRFLEGKAMTFYMQRVAKNVSEWTLQSFFGALFNEIFHRNFRIAVLDRIAEFSQGNRTVRTYANGLESLYDLLGDESHRAMVRKLWQGLRLTIRTKLYDYEYSPEVNTWDEIVHKAETIEIGEQEATREAARD